VIAGQLKVEKTVLILFSQRLTPGQHFPQSPLDPIDALGDHFNALLVLDRVRGKSNCCQCVPDVMVQSCDYLHPKERSFSSLVRLMHESGRQQRYNNGRKPFRQQPFP
jgi:hypothetical protein